MTAVKDATVQLHTGPTESVSGGVSGRAELDEMSERRPAPRDRASWAITALASALFVLLCWRQSEVFMVWDEETMVHSAPAPRVLAGELGRDGRPRLEASCADPTAPRFVLSSGRPRLAVCAAGRRWPLMIAPYFSGVFYWPFGLLAPLHHDDAFALRKLASLLGLASLLLTGRLVARLTNARTGALVALALGVSPTFVFLHAVLVHFETLPWLCLVAALLVLTRDGARPPSTRRLAAGGALLGLSVLANLKTVVLLAPLALVAWRLGPRGWFAPQPKRWAAAGAAGLLPLLPMFVVYALPAQGYGDRSEGWTGTLLRHLAEPQRLVPSARDMILWWSNVGYYFRAFVARAPFNAVALAVASLAAVFALVGATRALRRREGDAVVAACGAWLASYVLMVALLYEEFPANYTPLHAVFGVAVGVFAASAGRWVASRAGAWAALPVAVALIAPFGWSAAQTIDAARNFRLRTNVRTERALVAFLRARSSPGFTVLTVDARLAGVVDSISGGAVRTTQAHNYFQRCDPRARNANAQACLDLRWRALLGASGAPLRAVIPLDATRWGSGQLSLEPSMLRAARALGRAVTLEATFDTAGGHPALALYRVE